MTREDGFLSLLDGYLDENEGSTPLPDHVRDAIRADLPSTPQRRAWWPALRFPVMDRATRIALASAAAVAVTLLGLRLLVPGEGVGGPGDPSSPAATPETLPVATPGELPAAAALEPGAYFIRNPYTDADPIRGCERGCADYTRITFTLPSGWATRDGLVYKHLGQPGEVAFSAWTPDQVYADPCHWQASSLNELLDIHDHARVPALGSTALMNQVGREASEPSEVTLGGQLALRIELSIPAELELGTCDGGEFRSWSEWDVADEGNSHHAPGQVDVVFIVDVDRRPLVIDASHMPGTSVEDLAELEGILASIHIDR